MENQTKEIKAGTKFSTPFEDGCEAIDAPDKDGNFAAFDSDNVVCTFSTRMVIGHADYTTPIGFSNE